MYGHTDVVGNRQMDIVGNRGVGMYKDMTMVLLCLWG